MGLLKDGRVGLDEEQEKGREKDRRTSLEWDQENSYSFACVSHTPGRGSWIVMGTRRYLSWYME